MDYMTADDYIDQHLWGSHDDLPEDGCLYCKPRHTIARDADDLFEQAGYTIEEFV